MLGAGDCGARQIRGRTSVVPGGQDSPCFIWMSPLDCPGGRPALEGGCAFAVAAKAATTIVVMVTNLLDKESPTAVRVGLLLR
jgi:hypothetical protein